MPCLKRASARDAETFVSWQATQAPCNSPSRVPTELGTLRCEVYVREVEREVSYSDGRLPSETALSSSWRVIRKKKDDLSLNSGGSLGGTKWGRLDWRQQVKGLKDWVSKGTQDKKEGTGTCCESDKGSFLCLGYGVVAWCALVSWDMSFMTSCVARLASLFFHLTICPLFLSYFSACPFSIFKQNFSL